MLDPETVVEARRRKMAALYHRTSQADCPDKFRAVAEWWRLSAEESATPEAHLQYADAQDAIAEDMEKRPSHYRVKPIDQSCAQWSKV